MTPDASRYGFPVTVTDARVRRRVPGTRRWQWWHGDRWVDEAPVVALPVTPPGPVTRRYVEPDDDALTHHPTMYRWGEQPIKPSTRKRPNPGRPRVHRKLIPELAAKVCPHAHVGEWFRNTKGHAECAPCRVDQGKRYRERQKAA